MKNTNKQKVEIKEVLRCPLCGGEAEDVGHGISCYGCGLWLGDGTQTYERGGYKSVWNNRNDNITHTVAIEYIECIGQLGDKYRVHATPKEAAGEFWENGMSFIRDFDYLEDAQNFKTAIFGTTGIKVIEV